MSKELFFKKKLWGNIEGKDIWLFCLQNKKGTKLYVSNYGAIAQALWITDKTDHADDILLGYDNLSDYEQDNYYIGGVIGRHAGRIADSEIVLEGQKYKLASTNTAYQLHGGKKGFNKKVFDVLSLSSSSIVFTYLSKDMEEGFPGNLEVKITYTLDDDDKWHIEYECSTDKTTMVNLTQHAYFNLAGHSTGTINEHFLQINSSTFLPVNHSQVPTGKLATTNNSVFDFINLKKIGKEINSNDEQLILSKGYDHSWVLKKENSTELKSAAIATDPKTGRRLEVFTTEPAIHFYSGNFLNESVLGKDNAIYDKRTGFCLETQHYPDTPNHPDFPSITLQPGEKFYSNTIYAFSIDEE